MSSAGSAGARPRLWPLGAAATALLLAVCVVVGTGGALLLQSLRHHPATRVEFPAVRGALRGDAVWRPGSRAAPDFVLRDQWGQVVSLSRQRGHTVLLAFMDSHCKMLCTLEGPTIHDVLRRLGAASRRVNLLVVSVNPWEDTAASSRHAVAHWGLGKRARWLRGSPAELEGVWRSYGIEVVRAAGDVNHSSAIYLIDRRGYERAGFNYPFQAPEVARDLRSLLAQRSS